MTERIDARGKVVRELDIAELEAVAQALPDDIEAIAVCFRHA